MTGSGEGSQGGVDAGRLRAAFQAAAEHLREHAPAIDAINVYPVPDGDTGTNMAGTMIDAVASLPETVEGVGELLRSLARAALLSARGNSGVILSQALRGFAEGVGDTGVLDGPGLARGLESAARAAYEAVSEPAEGTMLTVLRRAAEAAADAAARGASCSETLRAAVEEAERAEERTPELLPILREAGVPDAGGEGICVLLRGLAAALSGTEPPARRPLPPPRHVPQADRVGFCTECLLDANSSSRDEVLEALARAGASSVVLTGEMPLLHVHFHSSDPDALLDLLERFGTVSRVKVEDMSAQHRRYLTEGSGATARVAVLALSPTPVLDDLFRGVGAEPLRASPLEKPNVAAILEAAEALHVPDIIVLPNHRDLLLSCSQAAGLTRRTTIHVVPTATIPEGLAAALACVPDRALTEVLEQMHRARERVHTVEVTRATGDRSVGGVEIRAGDFVALLDGRPVASGRELAQPALEALERLAPDGERLFTLFQGSGLSAAELDALAARIAERWPRAEVELLESGHELYPLIIGVE